jgi:hypothetical protein
MYGAAEIQKRKALAVLSMHLYFYKISRVEIETTEAEIDFIIRKYTPSLRKQLRQYWQREQNSITNSVISQFVNTGTYAQDYSIANTIEASNIPDYSKSYFKFFENWSLKAARDALARYANKIKLRISGRFIADLSSERLFSYIESEALQYARFLTRSRTLTLRQGLQFIVENDLSISEGTALMQQNMILTPRMAAGVRKSYLKDLEAGLTKKQALRRAYLKSERAKVWRAKMQIKTELNRAKQAADKEAIFQARQKGFIQDVWKEWERTLFVDARNHQNSIDNDGVAVPEDDLFPDGSDVPSEINENCLINRFMVKGGL